MFKIVRAPCNLLSGEGSIPIMKPAKFGRPYVMPKFKLFTSAKHKGNVPGQATVALPDNYMRGEKVPEDEISSTTGEGETVTPEVSANVITVMLANFSDFTLNLHPRLICLTQF